MDVRIESSWKKALETEFEKPYFADLSKAVKGSYLSSVVYPAPKNVFNAFSLCPFDQVKVVILGQDPYHGAGQAHGLSFSVPDGVKNTTLTSKYLQGN
jgi:uracil-DNA glycosylase